MRFKTALVSIIFILELSVLDKSCLELNWMVTADSLRRRACVAVGTWDCTHEKDANATVTNEHSIIIDNTAFVFILHAINIPGSIVRGLDNIPDRQNTKK